LDPLSKATLIQERWTKLLTNMKRLERDYQKSKRRADGLQKERDTAKSELTKMTSMKEKLEKLSRDTTNDNKKLRVRTAHPT
jgi:DNA anti-recombination protein RmuC